MYQRFLSEPKSQRLCFDETHRPSNATKHDDTQIVIASKLGDKAKIPEDLT